MTTKLSCSTHARTNTDVKTQRVFLPLDPEHDAQERHGVLASDAGHGVDFADETDATLPVTLWGVPAKCYKNIAREKWQRTAFL